MACEPSDCPELSNNTTPKEKATVDTNEPDIPKVNDNKGLTPEERRAKIDQLSEKNAKREITEKYENAYGMHSIEKHGTDIPDANLKQRAIDGTNPRTGKKEKVNSSSQFKSWKLHLHVLNDATSREARGLPKFTGKDTKKTPIVQGKLPDGGRGYKPNKKDPNNPKYNDSMNNYEVKFDRDTEQPFTAFPKD